MVYLLSRSSFPVELKRTHTHMTSFSIVGDQVWSSSDGKKTTSYSTCIVFDITKRALTHSSTNS